MTSSKKQSVANDKNSPNMAPMPPKGKSEMNDQMVTVKRLSTGTQPEVSCSDMSMPELIQSIEAKEVTAKNLPKELSQQCALFLKSRGYSNSSIANILDVNERTIIRYVKEIRKQESLKLGLDFQKNVAGEFMNNWRSRCQRLLILSYSRDLSAAEQIRAICAFHQVEKDGIEVLERLGYLNKKTGEMDLKNAAVLVEQATIKSASQKDPPSKLDEKLKKLKSTQIEHVRKQIQKADAKQCEDIEKEIDDLLRENERREANASK